jgi:streptogramin lyase
VGSPNTNNVLRYDETTGAFVDQFVKPNSGGLFSGFNMVLGPDHNLYVSNGLFSQNNKDNNVLRYDGTTGAFLGDFADSGQLTDPRGVVFGRDGNLYVADGDGPGRVLRYDGQTGAFLDTFVPLSSGGLSHPSSMLFGPDGNLYVMDTGDSEILRFQGLTGKSPGAFIDTFVTPGSGGMHQSVGMAFGPDGNLYVANSFANDSTSGGILRYNGKTGKFMDTFIAPGSDGLLKPLTIVFGPGGDLFVGSADTHDLTVADPHTSTVLRFQGPSGESPGAFVSTFVTADSGGLRFPVQLLFTETDPVTLAYRSGDNLTAAALAASPVNQTLRTDQVQPLLTEALARWQGAGVNSSALGNIQIQIADLGGTTLGLASGHTIWLDANAAGWGWFVDPTPHDDSEFATPGNQGEQNRIDLLTVLEHELGHLLGYPDAGSGLMGDTLAAGARLTPADVDPLFAAP